MLNLNKDIVLVEFLISNGGYSKGETAGFAKKVAKRLVDQGAAKYSERRVNRAVLEEKTAEKVSVKDAYVTK